MRLLSTVVLALSVLGLSAQMGDSISLKTQVYLDAYSELGSNGITMGSFFDYFSASFLDEELKDELTSDLRAKNGVGSSQDLEIGFRQWRDSTYSRWRQGFGIHYAFRSRAGVNASDNAILMTLYGNARFAGQTVDLLPLDELSMNWSEIGYTHIQRSKNLEWSASANLLFGHSFNSIESEKGTVFTEESGEYIDFDTRYTFKSSDSLLLLKGMGASIHFDVSYDLKGPWRVGLGVRDFGVIAWSRSSWEVNADSTFRFEGEEIPNLFDPSNEVFTGTGDRLEKTFYNPESGSQTTFLPTRIIGEVGYTVPWNFAKEISLRTDYIFLPGYSLRNRIRLDIPLNKAWSLKPEISQGGFARWGIGIGVQWKHPDWLIQLEAQNIQWTVASASSYGIGGQLKVAYNL